MYRRVEYFWKSGGKRSEADEERSVVPLEQKEGENPQSSLDKKWHSSYSYDDEMLKKAIAISLYEETSLSFQRVDT